MANPRSKLDEIVESFSTLEDPRSHINRRHPLTSVLVLAVLAVLAGAAGPTAIARRAKYKEDLLTGILDLHRGIPGKDLFRRVLMTLKPATFEAGFNAWIGHLRDEATAETGVQRPIVARDGNSARRSHDAAGLSDRFRPCYTAAVAVGPLGPARAVEDDRGLHPAREVGGNAFHSPGEPAVRDLVTEVANPGNIASGVTRQVLSDLHALLRSRTDSGHGDPSCSAIRDQNRK